MWQEIAFPFVGLVVNAVQIWWYLPFYLALVDKNRMRSLEYVSTLAALVLNFISVLKKLAIIILKISPMLGEMDILYKAADFFLIGYFFGIYLPWRVMVYLDKLAEVDSKK